jgi:preprotein translocase SecE subunit
MANITRIKAKDGKSPDEGGGSKTVEAEAVKKTDKKSKSEKKPKKSKELRGPIGYIKGSWQEIRQVRWPNRKTTWKMTLSVIIYVVIFGAVIMLLDMLFTFLFNLILGE